MDQIIFRGAFVRYADFRQEDEAGVFVRIHMTADFSEPVCEAMGWDDPGESITSAKLTGRLSASHLILTPAEKEMKHHELLLDIKDVGDFEYVCKQNGDGEAVSRELRFKVRTSVDPAEALVGQYVRRMGKGTGQLRISYVKQDALPLEAVVDQKECVDCENEIPFAAGRKDQHASGQQCTAYRGAEEGSTLAPAAVSGGTHQRKRSPAGVQ